MPEINRFGCDHCEFELPGGWGGYCYVSAAGGERVVCPHPCAETVAEVTGLSYGEAMDAGRVGFNSDCVCQDCLHQFNLDLKRDTRSCPKCASERMHSTLELVGQPCPKCKEGTIERGSPIRWKLDPDRAALPVPHIVKELVDYERTRVVTKALQQAANIVGQVPGIERHSFASIVIHLLDWWEGDYLGDIVGGGTDQHDCTDSYDDKWSWIQAFKAVIRGCDELAEIIEWREGRFCFKAGVSADLRRGMKNYVREHREHIVES